MKTAQVLVEALPYIKKFSGKTVVIKYGGHAMNNDVMKEKVISDIVLMKFVGINPVIVHGGGPAINYWIEKDGGEPQFINGLRVTDKDTMDIAQMVLVGQITRRGLYFLARFRARKSRYAAVFHQQPFRPQ